VDATRDRRPACGFCDGSGLWPDDDAALDPCPLCEGSGSAPTGAANAGDAPEPAPLERLSAFVARLTQPERQHLYEELHARYDCRIYR
jgi:hypothetical protein